MSYIMQGRHGLVLRLLEITYVPLSAQLHNPSKIFSIIQNQGRKTLI